MLGVPVSCARSPPTATTVMYYLAGVLLSFCCHLVRGQSAYGDVSCVAKHVSNWGDQIGELVIKVRNCDSGDIEWTLPRGTLKRISARENGYSSVILWKLKNNFGIIWCQDYVIFEDEWKSDYTVCLEQVDLSPWTSIRNMTMEVDNHMEPLKLPFGRPTCADSHNGILKVCFEKPLLRVYRTSLYFVIVRH